MNTIEVTYDVNVSEDDVETTYLEVNYNIIKRQPDVGIMSDYVEVHNVEFVESHYNLNRFAVADIEANEDKIKELVEQEVL